MKIIESGESMEDVTEILNAIQAGDGQAAEQLLPLVYSELRDLAARRLAREKPGQTLEPTALVHEAYLRLVGENQPAWNGRKHFLATAAEAMRRILIDIARRKQGPKQGGHLRRVDANLDLLVTDPASIDLLALDEALARLDAESCIRAELVKLRFFAGLTVPEAADVLGISIATAERYWTYSKAWLYAELTEEVGKPP